MINEAHEVGGCEYLLVYSTGAIKCYPFYTVRQLLSQTEELMMTDNRTHLYCFLDVFR